MGEAKDEAALDDLPSRSTCRPSPYVSKARSSNAPDPASAAVVSERPGGPSAARA